MTNVVLSRNSDLQYNQLSGTIPTEWGLYSGLRAMYENYIRLQY